MNKYSKLFNENMTELQANTVLFKTAKKLKNESERRSLLEAWDGNNKKITERESKENAGKCVFTQAIM